MSATLTISCELDGFPVALALEGASGNELLKAWPTIWDGLRKLGATAPTPAAPASSQAAQGGGGQGGDPETKICPMHHAPMQRRTGKGGDTWFSHKAVDPATGAEYWCRGGERNGGK